MIGALLLALAATPSALGDGFAQFSRSPAMRQDRTDVAFGALGYDRSSHEAIYWARRISTNRFGPVTTFADSRTCPAMMVVLGNLERLPPPTLDVPGLNDPDELKITMDGVGYRLSVTARYGDDLGRTEYGSNVNTPLAKWVDDSLARMEGCWVHLPPEKP